MRLVTRLQIKRIKNMQKSYTDLFMPCVDIRTPQIHSAKQHALHLLINELRNVAIKMENEKASDCYGINFELVKAGEYGLEGSYIQILSMLDRAHCHHQLEGVENLSATQNKRSETLPFDLLSLCLIFTNCSRNYYSLARFFSEQQPREQA